MKRALVIVTEGRKEVRRVNLRKNKVQATLATPGSPIKQILSSPRIFIPSAICLVGAPTISSNIYGDR